MDNNAITVATTLLITCSVIIFTYHMCCQISPYCSHNYHISHDPPTTTGVQISYKTLHQTQLLSWFSHLIHFINHHCFQCHMSHTTPAIIIVTVFTCHTINQPPLLSTLSHVTHSTSYHCSHHQSLLLSLFFTCHTLHHNWFHHCQLPHFFMKHFCSYPLNTTRLRLLSHTPAIKMLSLLSHSSSHNAATAVTHSSSHTTCHLMVALLKLLSLVTKSIIAVTITTCQVGAVLQSQLHVQLHCHSFNKPILQAPSIYNHCCYRHLTHCTTNH